MQLPKLLVTVMSAIGWMTGRSWSSTVTVKEVLVPWPHASVAVVVTVVVSTGNCVPETMLGTAGTFRSNTVLSIASVSALMKVNHR